MLSFSKRVKDELFTYSLEEKEFIDIYICAVIHSLASLNYSLDEFYLEIKSINIVLIRNLVKFIKKFYNFVDIQILIRENRNFQKQNKTFILRLKKGSLKLLQELDLYNEKEIKLVTKFNFPKYITKDDKTFKEYLKFFFICNGSINDPKIQKQYHLELINTKLDLLEKLQKIIEKYEINFKITVRKNTYALYLNKGEEISDFLKLIGCIQTLFEFEDYRLYRDIRAVENRLINAEIANDSKKQQAALKQIEAIKKIKKSGKWNQLKDKTQYVGELRIQNPEASLQKLVEISNQSISKSNIRHHLQIILKIGKEEGEK